METLQNLNIEKVACYIRVSSQEQKLHGISLDAQIDKLTEYAKTHNLKIIEWYKDEGVSGRKLIRNRPELQRMLNDAHARKFDRILFIKLDRFFRSVAEYHECMKYIDPVVWTATEEKYDLTTANGRAFVNMKLTIAELEADQTGERISIVNDYKVKTGQALTGSQSQGIGFMVQKDASGVKRVVQNPETAPIVMDYINYILTYQNKRQAALYINEKYNVDITYNRLSHMLDDTKLYGSYRGNDNYCDGYIDKATFDKIQAIVNGRNVKTQKSKRIYLYSGLIRCPQCGGVLSGTCSSKRTNIKPSGKVYVYTSERKSYRCNQHAINKSCDYFKRINEDKLEEALLDKLSCYITEYVTEVKIEDKRVKDSQAEDKVKALNEELRKTNRMYKNSAITDEEYDRDIADIRERLKRAEAQLKPVLERDLTIYNELLKNDWKSIYNALNNENKRAFWRKYIKEIKVNDNGLIDGIIFF